MKPSINKWMFAIFCFCAIPLYAQDTVTIPVYPTKDYVACFSAWDTILNTLQTRFTQQTQYDGITISQSTGRIIYIKKGHKLRLDNLEDTRITQTALTDKKQIYILDEKGKEISKISWQEWLKNQPNQALFDFGNYTALLRKHKVFVTQNTPEQVVLRLEPKDSQKNPYILFVTLQADTCFPQEISIEADLMTTTAKLENTQLNDPIEPDTFKRLK